jgi:adenylate cyclase class IV
MDRKPESFYEIELKAILDKVKYDELNQRLNSDPKFKLINAETIKTVFYKADAEKTDVRLRQSDKTIEIVYKRGLMTRICRREIKIPLASLAKLEYFIQIFDALPMEKQRPTIKHKQEFVYHFNGYDYVICLQYLEELAYVLEVEYLGETEEESAIHEPNLHAILAELGLALMDGAKYTQRVNDYKTGKNVIDYPI